MTTEEAKRRAELYSALADGKTIQILNMEGNWVDVEVKKLNYIPETLKFRIKPKSQYRPFETQEECWEEMHKHQPFGWVEVRTTRLYTLIIAVDKTNVVIPNSIVKFDMAFEDFKFKDGTPFGIKEE